MRAQRVVIVFPIGVIILAVGLLWCPAYSQDLQTKKALETIIETANQICQSAPLEETSQGINLTGDASAKLGGLVGKIADLGITGAAQYQTNRSMGVLQKDLIVAIQSGNNCKLEVFRTLEKDLISGRSAPSGNNAPPAQEVYTHPSRAGPSFPCGRATIEVEFLICRNAHLADLDLKMADAYQAALIRLPSASQQSLKREQYYWLQQRNACQQNSNVLGCVERAYSSRLSALAAY